MARIRTIKPEFWEDEKVAYLSRDARLMLIGCFNLADDEGLLRWTPAYIKSGLFMYDDDLTVDGVKSLMAEVTSAGIILTYSPAVKGAAKQQLAWIIKFRIHQKINRPQPSKLPPPPLQSGAIQDAYAERDGRICHLCGGPVNEVSYFEPEPYSPAERRGWACLNASLDHIKPRTKGGGDHPTNIALAHVGCNKGRRERPISDFSVPQSVRSALNSIGWISDLGVNESRNDSVNDSVSDSVAGSPPDMEGEREQGREQGREEQTCATKLRDSAPPQFAEFWDAYPRRRDRRKAEKAFTTALKRADPDTIIAGANRYAADPNRLEQYTKYAEGWLNGDGWLDEPLPPRNGHGPPVATSDLRVAQVQALKSVPSPRLELQ